MCNTDENTVGIRIYIGNKIADTMLPYLKDHKDTIEIALSEKLMWDPNPNNMDKIISLLHSTDFKDDQKVEEAIKWLVQKTIEFREVFSKFAKTAP